MIKENKSYLQKEKIFLAMQHFSRVIIFVNMKFVIIVLFIIFVLFSNIANASDTKIKGESYQISTIGVPTFMLPVDIPAKAWGGVPAFGFIRYDESGAPNYEASTFIFWESNITKYIYGYRLNNDTVLLSPYISADVGVELAAELGLHIKFKDNSLRYKIGMIYCDNGRTGGWGPAPVVMVLNPTIGIMIDF